MPNDTKLDKVGLLGVGKTSDDVVSFIITRYNVNVELEFSYSSNKCGVRF